MYFVDDQGNQYVVSSLKDFTGEVLLLQGCNMFRAEEVRKVTSAIQEQTGSSIKVVMVPPGFKVIGTVRAIDRRAIDDENSGQ